MYNKQGHFLSRRIFWEHSTPADRVDHPPLYTLGQEERWDEEQEKMLPSAYEIYMDSVDEYDAAIKLVKNLKNWGKLVNAHWFMEGSTAHKHEGLIVWREHMRMRDASASKKALQVRMKDGDTAAAKAIFAETKTKAAVGRKGKTVEKKDTSTNSRVLNFNKNKVKG